MLVVFLTSCWCQYLLCLEEAPGIMLHSQERDQRRGPREADDQGGSLEIWELEKYPRHTPDGTLSQKVEHWWEGTLVSVASCIGAARQCVSAADHARWSRAFSKAWTHRRCWCSSGTPSSSAADAASTCAGSTSRATT